MWCTVQHTRSASSSVLFVGHEDAEASKKKGRENLSRRHTNVLRVRQPFAVSARTGSCPGATSTRPVNRLRLGGRDVVRSMRLSNRSAEQKALFYQCETQETCASLLSGCIKLRKLNTAGSGQNVRAGAGLRVARTPSKGLVRQVAPTGSLLCARGLVYLSLASDDAGSLPVRVIHRNQGWFSL